MAEYIPFLTSAEAHNVASNHFADAEMFRVPFDKAEKLSAYYHSSKLWIDPAFDGFDNISARQPTANRSNRWFELMATIKHFQKIANTAFWIKPDPAITEEFVTDLLDRCHAFKSAWITVPQLPLVNDSTRNKMNLALAKATGKWKSRRNFSGRLILPLIFTHQKQLNGKTERNPKVKHGGRCYHEAQADGFWAVDQSLADDSGSLTLRDTRFPGIIELHKELNSEIQSRIRVAGPYWALNLVLWARGLIDFPAIGLGNSYQYSLSGGFSNMPSVYIAIESLRRRVGIQRLDQWLDQAMNDLGMAHPIFQEFSKLKKQLGFLTAQNNARNQVAKFYKSWFGLLATRPPAGRAIALFQDLSAAYALGKSLQKFDKSEGAARKPESVVETFMLSCL